MPSTLGIVASHNNYQPPTFTIVPDKTAIKEGEIVTYTITTTNYSSPNIYVSNSGTVANADLNPSPMFSRTIPLVGGTATFTLTGVFDESDSETSETIVVNLRTGSTVGPIVATAPTVTLNNRPFSLAYTSPSQSTRNTTTNITNNIPNRDGRWFRLILTATSTGGTASCNISINGVIVASRTSNGQTTVYRQINAGDIVTLYTTYSMFNSAISNGSVTARVDVYQEII